MDRLTFSDERLMTLAAGGDEQAFQALVRRQGATILTVARRMVPGAAAAEEVFADVVVKVWLRRGTYGQGRPVRPWLMGIAANACREWARGAGRRRARGLDDSRRGDSGVMQAPEARLVGDEGAARIEAALARLPERQREVLVLRVWGELDYEQIASALGVAEGTARSNMHHALAAMRRMLGSMTGDSERDGAEAGVSGAGVRKGSAER